jgi:hypothetical protein
MGISGSFRLNGEFFNGINCSPCSLINSELNLKGFSWSDVVGSLVFLELSIENKGLGCVVVDGDVSNICWWDKAAIHFFYINYLFI